MRGPGLNQQTGEEKCGEKSVQAARDLLESPA
jgi:hypothetical protein